MIGVNSRLDTLQAAILRAKLPHMQRYCDSRGAAAAIYDEAFSSCDYIVTPARDEKSTHVFHQYTIKVKAPYQRDELKAHLQSKGVPSMVYYPLPLHHQEAYKHYTSEKLSFEVTEQLCKEVLSLPMHTELTQEEMDYIIASVLEFFNQ